MATLGTLVAAWAFTGWRSYDILFLPVLLAGLALIVAGSWWAGRNRARQGRLVKVKESAVAAADRSEVRGAGMRYRLECRRCRHVFDLTADAPPAAAACPVCGHTERVVPAAA